MKGLPCTGPSLSLQFKMCNPKLFAKCLQIDKIMLNFSLMELYITTIYCKGKTVLVVFILTVLI